ncbi:MULTISPECIES: head maturation protease, ClpP-related [Lactiplantibacillus]|uniref:ATP-dependent Clp protease proteolytic subunit n=1 Tax=Lactiplantibacillus paraplantarum TaxID=60520 RepID=A0AAD0TN40_9LACO|nr:MULTISPECIES: head maturation protease, ClpP-related [Lactiplantibacillus]AYJ38190.1 Clp protease ClpP [Lactiplantibacillus paraplantarum]KRL49583.1 peptidase S14 ClpP [Lactiplantibacillus paraplantarum DSM 10667]MBU7465843.1 Clp protease ClpP [Lactiplantibacillus pentosus]MBU7489665.1 Clp protease ClpP [Lactiplantibacillus pentosus]MDT6968121.1 Clp protease ClpP [Lactiplantibacillus pentosus]
METVPIKGVVSSDDDAEVYQFFGYSTVTPTGVITALKNAGGMPIKAEINSPGGDVFAGSEIFTALKNYSGNVEVDIVGLAASAASIIAMAGDQVKISPTGQLMIHRASTVSQGNSDDLSSDLQGLDSTDQAIVNVYQEKTGMDPQNIYRMMSEETWINAQEAVKQGFADEIMFTNQTTTVANTIDSQKLLSKDIISKVKSLMHKSNDKNTAKKENTTNSQFVELRKSKLAILFGKN